MIEVLLAIFILGIGAISIAAIFPAGIVQQREAVDDMLGPTVANNALEVIRAKVSQADFGTYEVEFSAAPPIFTIPGDWPWSRPSFFTDSATIGGVNVPQGSIAIFDDGLGQQTRTEIPHNSTKHGDAPPEFIITQGERYYPQASVNAVVETPPTPQYVWDCMFRRFEGRIYVAIFVYRVALPNIGSFTYQVPPNPTDPDLPPVPIALDFRDLGEPLWDAHGEDLEFGTADDAEVPGTAPATPYDPTDNAEQWQFPGQWVLDQNNNVHRVLFGREHSREGPVILHRPVPAMPALSVYSSGTDEVEDIVSNIWYMPTTLETTLPGGVDAQIAVSPVYLMVREL